MCGAATQRTAACSESVHGGPAAASPDQDSPDRVKPAGAAISTRRSTAASRDPGSRAAWPWDTRSREEGAWGRGDARKQWCHDGRPLLSGACIAIAIGDLLPPVHPLSPLFPSCTQRRSVLGHGPSEVGWMRRGTGRRHSLFRRLVYHHGVSALPSLLVRPHISVAWGSGHRVDQPGEGVLGRVGRTGDCFLSFECFSQG